MNSKPNEDNDLNCKELLYKVIFRQTSAPAYLILLKEKRRCFLPIPIIISSPLSFVLYPPLTATLQILANTPKFLTLALLLPWLGGASPLEGFGEAALIHILLIPALLFQVRQVFLRFFRCLISLFLYNCQQGFFHIMTHGIFFSTYKK